MHRKIFISFLLFISINALAYSDLIDRVVIVRPYRNEEAGSCYQSIATWLENSRSDELAREFRNRGESAGFGSGFIVDGPGDKKYIITNYHVISQSDSASVEFRNHDGDSFVYEDCPVVIVDENKDLAILLLNRPENDRSLEGVIIRDEFYEDGREVWTAGYPGFGSDPLWQFAKGTITNQKARITELGVNGLDYVIQHSSIIDSGSSGGPLLIRNSEKGTFEVIGVNTWTALGRNNTYFSIPSRDLLSFIKSIDDDKTDINSLENKARSFAEVFSTGADDFLNHRSYFSYNYTFNKGWKSYSSFRKSISGTDLDTWDSCFFYSDPFGVMKKSVYRDVRSDFEGRNISFVSIGNKSDVIENKQVTVRFSEDGIPFDTIWILEYGAWRLLDSFHEFEALRSAESGDKVIDESLIRKFIHMNSISVRPSINFGRLYPDTGWGATIVYESYFGKYVSLSIGAGYSNLYDFNFIDAHGSLRFQLPLSLSEGNFYLTPFVSVGSGFDVDLSRMELFIPLSFSGGLEIAAGKYRDTLSLGLEFSYIQLFDPLGSSGSLSFDILKPSMYMKWFF